MLELYEICNLPQANLLSFSVPGGTEKNVGFWFARGESKHWLALSQM